MRVEPRMKAGISHEWTHYVDFQPQACLLFKHVCPPNFRPISLSASWGSSSNAVLRCFEVYHNLPKDSTPSLTKLGSVSSGREIGTHTGLWLVLQAWSSAYIDRHQNVSAYFLPHILSYIYIYINFTHGKTCLDLPSSGQENQPNTFPKVRFPKIFPW